MDNETLDKWMSENNIESSALAEKLGVSYEYIYKLRNKKAQVGGGFKWRFGITFGFEKAVELFGEVEESQLGAEVQCEPTH